MHLSWSLKLRRLSSLAIFIPLWVCSGWGSLLNSTVPPACLDSFHQLVAAPSSSPFLPSLLGYGFYDF